MPTAIAAPATGPTRYAHHDVQSPSTRAGPSERAGFIDAPLTGAPYNLEQRDVAAQRRWRPAALICRTRRGA